MPRMRNVDDAVVRGFGDQWARLDQGGFTGPDFERAFDAYFHIFPWHLLSQNAEGFDLGCGSGRWARAVAPRVGILHRIEPSGCQRALVSAGLLSKQTVLRNAHGCARQVRDPS